MKCVRINNKIFIWPFNIVLAKMLLFLLMTVCHAEKWWSTLKHSCDMADSRLCLANTLTKQLKSFDRDILNGLKSAVELELDFVTIKLTVDFIREQVLLAASLGESNLVFSKHDVSCKSNGEEVPPRVFDCNLYIHALQQELVYLFKDTNIKFKKENGDLISIELIWK